MLRIIWLSMVIITVILLALGLAGKACANEESKGDIKGYVLNSTTREPITGANVVVTGTHKGAATDLSGQFLIKNLFPGTYSIQVSALGFSQRTISEIVVTPARTRSAEFLLEPALIKSEEVVFTRSSYITSTPEMPVSARNLRYEEIRRAPGGLEDVQRTIHSLPGIVSENDQDNAIVVRGGSPFENLTVIEGIEMNNTNHLTVGSEGQGNGGPINALNTEFLQDVTFASGGFSAKYGDKMSSVLELELRDGNRERFSGAADLNMVGIGGYLEGPVNNGKGSIIASFRKSYLDLIPEESVNVDSWPQYWNTQFKLSYDLSSRHKLSINCLYLEDKVANEPDIEEDENGNLSDDNDALNLNTERYMLGARLRSVWGPGFTDLVMARSFAYTHWNFFELKGDIYNNYLHRTLSSKREEIYDQFHLHWNGKGFGNDKFSAGISLKPVTYKYRFWAEGDSILYDDDYLGRDPDTDPDMFYYDDQFEALEERGLKYSSYLQYTWRPLRNLDLTAGVRHDGFDYPGKDVVGPRISSSWEFIPRWSMNLAWGTYYQSQDPSIYMNREGRDKNKNLPYSRADQYIAGITYAPKSSTMFSLEGFYKDYQNLLVAEEEIVREQTGDKRFQSDYYLAEREKEAWGIELFAQQKLMTNWYGSLSYSYGNAEAEDPAYGSFPSSFDYRHVLTTTLGYKTSLVENATYRNFLHKPWGWWLWILPLNGNEVTFSTRYRYMSGRPYTSQVYYGDGEMSPEPIHEGHWEDSGINNSRYPDYSRWDIRFDSKHFYGKSAFIFYLEVENVDDHLNVADYDYKDNGDRETQFQFRQLYVLGLRYEF